MPTSYNTGYNPPQSVVPYPNPDVIITKATPIADELQRSASVSTQDQLALILAQQHKVYSEYLHQWCDWYNWYTGEYIQQYIYKHVREHESHYKQRQERAYYFNYVDSIISLIGSFLYSRAITRSFTRESPEESEAQDEEQTAFWNDIDLRGTNINDFMRRVFNFTKIFGYVDVVVDMPLTTEEIITEQDRLNNNMRPYCYVILPFNMINWEVDEYGDFLWVRWKEDIQKMYDPFQLMPINRTTRYTTWTRNEWYIHEVIYSPGQAARALLVDSGEHNLGVVPVVRFYGKKDLVCETMGRSLVAVIGKINIEILNICSLVDSELYQKALNILVMADPNQFSDTVEDGNKNNQQGIEIGSNNVLFYTGDKEPYYLAPASDPGQAMMDWTAKCIEEIYRISTLGYDTGVDQTKSGVSYCLARGTLIDCPRDLTQYPDGIPIEELVGKGSFYIYSRLNGAPAVCLAKKAWQSGTHQPVYRVNYEWYAYGHWYYGSITATANHRFMLRDGSYCRLKNLEIGDSLMPFARSLNGRGHRPTIGGPGMDREYEHRFIMRQLIGEAFDESCDVHHINHNKLDNRVENLEAINQSVHKSYHARENVERIREGAQKRFADGNGRWLEFSEKDVLLALERSDWRTTVAARDLGVAFVTLKKKMLLHNISIPNNHKITSIEFAGYEDVYDIEVPIAHNFVANGIIVHNSYEFNMTNRMLADNADLMQNGEEQVHRLFARWMSTEFDGYVDYPDSFDVGSYRDEIQSLMDAKDVFRSPTLVRELEKKLGRKMLARSSADVANQIMEEIDTLPEKTTVKSNPFQRQLGDPTSPQQLEREQENRELKQESISGNT